MAALSTLESQLRGMMECKVCYEERDVQKQLPCQHTLCLPCLKKLKLDNGNKYKCPLCSATFPVPNKGFEALDDSLMTKQLASILKSSELTYSTGPENSWHDADVSTFQQGSDEAKRYPSDTEAGRKLRSGAQRAKQVLSIAQQKLTNCSTKKTECSENSQVLIDKLTQFRDKKIAELNKQTQEKIEAVKSVTESKLTDISDLEKTLTAAVSDTETLIDELETKAANTDQDAEDNDVTDDLQQVTSSVSKLEGLIRTPDSANLKKGDSVRLAIQSEEIDDDFMENDISHTDVGYIHEIKGEKCGVIFAADSTWVGTLTQVELSPVKHSLPVVGDHVRIKPSVEKPHFGLGHISKDSVGVLKEIKNCGPAEGREVACDFPEQLGWKGIYDELEFAAPEQLKVGDEVWVRLDISTPAGGWAGVTHNSRGTLLSVSGEDVVVKFPQCEQWRGLISEIERTRAISAGDKVKVLESVTEPKTGWAGVSHKDEGIVKALQVKDGGEKLAVIDFPNLPKLWKCFVSELELVERGAKSTRRSDSQTIRHEIVLPGLQELHERTQRQMHEHAEQCAQQ